MEIIWKTIQLSCLFFLLQSFLFRTKDFLVRDFGAKADGITLNVATIQKVIDFSMNRAEVVLRLLLVIL